ncbi:MATE family efflux transporter [Rivibacter subsaxonicus]|uniref:MATE family multidrug resistance protein n=1 Tax=Rivibacter subsaxonicus TaxID=457575 RepID=A0A4Q7VNY3_9BURK|nr:MATE family efflux transporter [Rivibacter subsaxonicus]RZT98052.1 MATE family multidrug resistance protein [Rivibacter subsaxonicus]
MSATAEVAALPAARRPALAIARHAASILVGQLAVIGFAVADAVMVGRHDSVDLAALSIGAAVYVSVYIGVTGVVQALIPIVGHHHGARDQDGVRRSFQQGVWLALMLALLGFALLQWPQPLLDLTQAEPAVLERARAYLGWLAWALWPALLFRVYSSFNLGLSRPWFVTALQLGALLLKVALNAWLIGGGLGVPALGVVGCAVATLLIQLALVATGGLMLARHAAYRSLQLFSPWSRPHGPTLRELLRLGIPAGASVFFEVTGFTLMAIFIARQGTTALAAHQIAVSLGSVIYMLPLSIGIATGALAAQALGAANAGLARRICVQGLALALCCALLLGLVLGFGRESVASLYSRDAAVLALAAPLLLLVAAMQLLDATQCVVSFALRAYRVAVLPAIAYALGLWGIGIGGGRWLAANPPPGWPAMLSGPGAFWFMNIVALAAVCAVLVPLLQRVSRRARD